MKKREKEIINSVTTLLCRYLHPKKIFLFGSRSKGNNDDNADFDFAIDCEDKNLLNNYKLLNDIDKVRGLYKIDLVNLNTVDAKLKIIIKKTGKIIYAC